MSDDLDLGVQIVGVPIVREADGLAMSSRNRYLDDVEREQAGALSAALLAGMYAASHGAAEALDAARAVLDEVPALEVDYLEVRDTWLGPAPAEGAGPHAGGGPARAHPAAGQHRHRRRRRGGYRRALPRRVGAEPELPWRN